MCHVPIFVSCTQLKTVSPFTTMCRYLFIASGTWCPYSQKSCCVRCNESLPPYTQQTMLCVVQRKPSPHTVSKSCCVWYRHSPPYSQQSMSCVVQTKPSPLRLTSAHIQQVLLCVVQVIALIKSAKHVVRGAGKGPPNEGSLRGACPNCAVAAVPRCSSGCSGHTGDLISLNIVLVTPRYISCYQHY